MSEFFTLPYRTIQQRMVDNWNTENGIVLYEDDEVDPPEDANFLRLTVLFGEAKTISLGDTKLERSYDMLCVQVFVIKGQGSQKVLALCDIVGDLFRNWDTNLEVGGRLIFRSAKVKLDGSNGTHYQGTVFVPYQRDLYI